MPPAAHPKKPRSFGICRPCRYVSARMSTRTRRSSGGACSGPSLLRRRRDTRRRRPRTARTAARVPTPRPPRHALSFASQPMCSGSPPDARTPALLTPFCCRRHAGPRHGRGTRCPPFCHRNSADLMAPCHPRGRASLDGGSGRAEGIMRAVPG